MKTCPSCGEENSDRGRFCQVCGSALADTRTAAREERKVVTVLFCDLVEFTASSDEADPEDVRARIRPYHARLRTEIERYGGTVEEFIGVPLLSPLDRFGEVTSRRGRSWAKRPADRSLRRWLWPGVAEASPWGFASGDPLGGRNVGDSGPSPRSLRATDPG